MVTTVAHLATHIREDDAVDVSCVDMDKRNGGQV